MSCGGSAMKMAKGGTAKKSCPPGYHWTVQGCQETPEGYKKPLSSGSSKIGIGTILAGGAGMIGAAVKKKRDQKKNMKAAEATAKAAKSTSTSATAKQKTGGSVKKYATGGSTGMVGMPQYGNNPRTYSGNMLQKGGSFAPNRAVQASCKNGMVRDASGRCVMERKMAKGGFPDLNKDGKITKADILKGRGVIKKKGGTVKKK